MSAEKPQVVHRRDYRPPDYRIDSVDLDFDLREDETLVRARLAIRRDPAVQGDAPPLVLAGQGLETLSLAIDGRPLGAREYGIDDDALEIPSPPERFELESLVRIHPERNTALSGLYRSSGEIRTGLIEEIEIQIDTARLMFEAPQKAQQVWLIKHFGANVNLGNIPPGEVIALETMRQGLRADTMLERQ